MYRSPRPVYVPAALVSSSGRLATAVRALALGSCPGTVYFPIDGVEWVAIGAMAGGT